MRLTVFTVVMLAAAFVVPSTMAAQELPGTGGDCDQACGSPLYQNGVPIGFMCLSVPHAGRKNCQASEDECVTDPCGGFAIMNGSGIMLAVGTCSERTLVEKDPLAVITRVAAKSGSSSPKETGRSELTQTAKRSATE